MGLFQGAAQYKPHLRRGALNVMGTFTSSLWNRMQWVWKKGGHLPNTGIMQSFLLSSLTCVTYTLHFNQIFACANLDSGFPLHNSVALCRCPAGIRERLILYVFWHFLNLARECMNLRAKGNRKVISRKLSNSTTSYRYQWIKGTGSQHCTRSHMEAERMWLAQGHPAVTPGTGQGFSIPINMPLF